MLLKFNNLLYILSLILLVGCSLDREKLTNPNLPYWSTHFEVPLTTKIISINEIISDMNDSSISKISFPNNINITPNLFAFKDTIIEDLEPISLGNTEVQGFSDSMTSELGPIELSPINSPNNPQFKLGEIAPGLTSLNGQLGEIPSFKLETIEKSFLFDGFQKATFKSGNLIIDINNKLQIDLDSISVKIKSQNGTYIDSTIIEKVPAGNLENGIIDLTNTSLPQNILIEVDGKSPGSSPNQVSINTNDYFEVIINGNNLKVSSAIAKIPPQNSPITGNGNIPLPQSDNKISEAIFEKAYLKVIIDNQLNLDIDTFIMVIPNIQNEFNIPDTLIVKIPRNTKLDTISNLIDKKMVIYSGTDFQEFLALNQNINYNYNVILENPNDYRNVTEFDKINVSFYFLGDIDIDDSSIKFSQITGNIEERQEAIGPINQSPPSLPPEMEDFILLDKYVEMSLYLKTNSNNIPLRLNMEIIALNGDSILITSSVDNWDISKRGPIIPIPLAADIINSRPEFIKVTGNAIVGNDNNFTTISIVDEILIQSNFIIIIPFVFKIDNNTSIEDPPELITPNNFEELPLNFNDIESIKLMINYDNQFGFGTDISVLAALDTMHFADTSSIKPDTLIHSLFLENSTQSIDSIILSNNDFNLLKDSVYIKTKINMFGDEIFFFSTDSLIIKLSTAIDYLINAPDSSVYR